MNLRVFEALANIFLMCDFQFRSFLIVTPKYLTVSVDFSSIP